MYNHGIYILRHGVVRLQWYNRGRNLLIFSEERTTAFGVLRSTKLLIFCLEYYDQFAIDSKYISLVYLPIC